MSPVFRRDRGSSKGESRMSMMDKSEKRTDRFTKDSWFNQDTKEEPRISNIDQYPSFS